MAYPTYNSKRELAIYETCKPRDRKKTQTKVGCTARYDYSWSHKKLQLESKLNWMNCSLTHTHSHRCNKKYLMSRRPSIPLFIPYYYLFMKFNFGSCFFLFVYHLFNYSILFKVGIGGQSKVEVPVRLRDQLNYKTWHPQWLLLVNAMWGPLVCPHVRLCLFFCAHLLHGVRTQLFTLYLQWQEICLRFLFFI